MIVLDQFEKQVDGWVRDALVREPADLISLVRELPGIYPLTVVEALARVATPEQRALIMSGRGLPVAFPSNDVPECFRRLRPPHPLDYEWRFTYRASVSLVELALSLSPQARMLACFGAPTVGIASLEAGRFGDTLVVDSNRAVLHEIRTSYPRALLVEADLLATATTEVPPFEVAILDPPWYPEHFEGFLRSCSASIVPEGQVLMVVPMAGTRPGMAAERLALEAMIRAVGGEIRQRHVGFVDYETPRFEQNALRAAGISVTGSWRRADLWCLSMGRVRLPSVSPIPAARGPEQWQSYIIEGHDIRVRSVVEGALDFGKLTLRTLVQGDVLPTVSRRSAIREQVHLWTSGNRVFATDNLAALNAILAAAAQVGLSAKAVRQLLGDGASGAASNVDQVVERLRQIIDSERRPGEQLNVDEGRYQEALGSTQ